MTASECDELLLLFEHKNKFKDLGNFSYKLIYKRSRDGYSVRDFADKVHDKQNILCIILADEKNAFGGYTSIGWTGQPFQEYDDDKAFIFLIRSSEDYPMEIFNALQDKKSIRLEQDYYCMFGEGLAIWLNGFDAKGGCFEVCSFETPSGRETLQRDDEEFDPMEVEVFQLTQ